MYVTLVWSSQNPEIFIIYTLIKIEGKESKTFFIFNYSACGERKIPCRLRLEQSSYTDKIR